MPEDAVPGLYTFTGAYDGKISQHYFMVDCPQTIAIDFETVRENIIYQASSSITTANNITVYSSGGLTAFQAFDFIEINNEFTVTPGSQFEIRIGGCLTNQQSFYNFLQLLNHLNRPVNQTKLPDPNLFH